MPYNSGYATERALGAMDNYNTNRNELKAGYPSVAIKIRDQIFQSIFAPWVNQTNRKRSLDKCVQYAIDNWGVINAGDSHHLRVVDIAMVNLFLGYHF